MFDGALHFLVDEQERPDWGRLPPYNQKMIYEGKFAPYGCR
jgi:hypothetical protein